MDYESYGVPRDLKVIDNYVSYQPERTAYDDGGGNEDRINYVGLNLWYCDSYTVSNNTLNGNETTGIYTLGGQALITNNTLIQTANEFNHIEGVSTGCIIYFNQCERTKGSVKITGNTIQGCQPDAGRYAIYVSAGAEEGGSKGVSISGGVLVSGNSINHNKAIGGGGIYCRGVGANTINGCIIEANNIRKTHNGIYMTGTYEGIISNNRVLCNLSPTDDGIDFPTSERNGVRIHDCRNTNVTNNNITMNKPASPSYGFNNGILVSDSAGSTPTKNILVSGNMVKGDHHTSLEGVLDTGIKLQAYKGVFVTGNSVYNIQRGFYSETGALMKQLRTSNNFYYPGDDTTEDAGEPWGKEMDTGFTPQVESRTGASNLVRERPANCRFTSFVFTRSLDELLISAKHNLMFYEGIRAALGLEADDTILSLSYTMVIDDPDAPGGLAWGRIKHSLLRGYNLYNRSIDDTLSWTLTHIHEENLSSETALINAELQISILALVADSVDTDGATY
jgi:nitrous oxidase accessory protein NosD